METALTEEIKRLINIGLRENCFTGEFSAVAALTSKINRLKKDKNAVICAHVYQTPDIIYGVGDFIGDSYKLADDSRKTDADIIIFCGARFMGETAKILNPGKKVYVPSTNAGCSLSESITAEDVGA